MWSDGDTFSEVATPQKLRELVESRLRPWGDFDVSLERFDEDTGAGAITVADQHSNVTAIPFRLPEAEERFYRLCRDILQAGDSWNSPNMAERHGRHKRELGD